MLNFVKTLITGILVLCAFVGTAAGLVLVVTHNHWEESLGNIMIGSLLLIIAYAVGVIVRATSSGDYTDYNRG